MLYAVIKTGGKQYRVSVGDSIYVEKLPQGSTETVRFDALMVSDGETVRIGTPIVESVSVEGRVLRHVKGRKLVVFRYKPKKNVRKKTGHRQPYTHVEITAING
ncbi:MAG: 50S ribosomal protein L21 [Christensenellales bacterium]